MTLAEAALIADTTPSPRPISPRYSVVLTLSEQSRSRADRIAPLLSLAERGVEVLLVHPGLPGELPGTLVSRRGLRIAVAASGSSREDLRALGMANAGGDIVVMLEEGDLADGSWQKALRFVPTEGGASAFLKSS